jgi:hypothetical protein
MRTFGIETRRKSARTSAFNKRAYVACALLTMVWALIHFRNDLPVLNVSSALSHEKKHDLLTGSILLPYAGDVCRQRLINNATGQIRDDGLVICSAATANNAQAWGQIMTEQKTTQIRSAFQNQ